MIKIEQTGVGTVSHPDSIRDSVGVSLLPVQGQVQGTVTFRLLGRVSPDAPWLEIRASNSVDFLESISWVPYIELEVLTGTGSVTLWVGEK